MPALIPLTGVELIVSDHLNPDRFAQVRFPRSKRKRIRRTWRKNRRNWGWVPGDGPECVRVGGRYYCTPRYLARAQAICWMVGPKALTSPEASK